MNMNVPPFGESLGTLEPGALVLGGRYRVERLLGAGGMGAVYLVTHVSLNELRALKVIRPDVLYDEAARLRFRREAQVQSRVRHANVVTVHDFGESVDSNVWMVLEYADGIPLDELLAAEGPLSAERTAAIMLGVCRGVAAAHAAGIIHRDLKPGNILITRALDGRELPKVLDFGIARPVAIAGAQSSAVARLTSTNMFVGTPAYLSPDQLTETTEQPLDTRSDVYTIGLIVIELLTGTVPTRSATIAEMLQRTMQPVPSLRTLRSDVDWPEALEVAVARAVHVDREQRTPSAQEFADEFCNAVIVTELGRASRIFPEWTPRAMLAVTPTPTATTAMAPSVNPTDTRSGTPSVQAATTRSAAVHKRSLVGPVVGALAVAGIAALWWSLQFGGKAAQAPSRDSLAAPTGLAPASKPPAPPSTLKRSVAGPPALKDPKAGSSGAVDSDGGARDPGVAPVATAAAVAALLAAAERDAGSDTQLRTRLREADALLAKITLRADSVAVGYVALEAEVLLARDVDACRRLNWLRGRSVGSRFAAAIGVMADSLPCGR